MKDNSSKSQAPQNAQKAQKPKPKGFIMGFVGIFVKLILMGLLGAFFLSICFIGLILFKGQDAAWTIAQNLLGMNTHFIESSQSVFGLKFSYCFWSFYYFLNHFVQPAEQLGVSVFQLFLKWTIVITSIECSRFLIFFMAVPMIGLIISISFVDGLVKRDIRKFQGARESTFLFHRPKPLVSFCFFMPILIYLSLPIAINPALFFIGMAIALGVITNLSLTYFKKYL